MRRWLGVAVIVAAVGVACTQGAEKASVRVVPGGSPRVGKALMRTYGCGSCHIIPGVKDADGLVGPPLIKFGRRSFIAGQLANTPDNLIRWIVDPRVVEPGTDMPDLNVTEQEARNIAAYLEQLG